MEKPEILQTQLKHAAPRPLSWSNGASIAVPRKETIMVVSHKTLALVVALAAFAALHLIALAKLQASNPAQPALTHVHGAD